MPLAWRCSLVVVFAATVFAGLLPQTAPAGARPHVATTTGLVQDPASLPTGCSFAMCGKNAPGTPAPTLAIAGMAVLAATAVVDAGRRLSRRRRVPGASLARGIAPSLFRPPQFA